MGVFKRPGINKEGKQASYWYIRYSLNGRMKWESVGKVGEVTKDVARSVLEDRKRQIKLGQHNQLNSYIPTLEEFSPDYIKYQRDINKKRSYKGDERHLKQLNKSFGTLKLSNISSKDIDDYKEFRLQTLKPASVNRELAVLRHLYNLAKRWKKFYGENPVSESGLLKEDNQVERILTYEEEERLLDESADHLKPIILSALNTGMRKNELLSLLWTDIDLNKNIIKIRQTVSKSKKSRLIPISSTLRKILLEQKLKTGQSEYIFLSPQGNPYLRPDSLKRCFEGACKRANIVGLRFHDLRHTAATRMIEKGANIVAVSKILGHADIKTTMRYAHPDSTLKDAVEMLAVNI